MNEKVPTGQELREMVESFIASMKANIELWPSVYDGVAEQMHVFYRKLVEKGFTEEQALDIIKARGTSFI
jgi:hypothetical protein